jgi:hypothetical protein
MSKRSKKERATDVQEAIRRILFNDWDPIGVKDIAPGDEYDSYIGGIYRLLVSGADEYKIIERLYHYQTAGMGLRSDSREELKSVAEKLMKLDVSL